MPAQTNPPATSSTQPPPTTTAAPPVASCVGQANGTNCVTGSAVSVSLCEVLMSSIIIAEDLALAGLSEPQPADSLVGSLHCLDAI